LLVFGCGSGDTVASRQAEVASEAGQTSMVAQLIEQEPVSTETSSLSLRVASFNIQFLGFFKHRDNAAVAALLERFDLIFIQELTAPPYPSTFPDGSSFNADEEAAAFFGEMTARGFEYVLSEEDTGTGPNNHNNGSATEWFAAFYRPEHVEPAPDLYTGFIAEDRTDHAHYERVPYAFGFRGCMDAPSHSCSEDLVFISVHLKPDSDGASTARRAEEIGEISSWVNAQSGAERDYVVLGDMNLEDCEELSSVIPDGFVSLNGECLPTNTNINGPKPYDHVFLRPAETGDEIDMGSFEVVDLIAQMEVYWNPDDGPYPGDPYIHNAFRQRYSDHHPVSFTLRVDGVDDD